MIRLTMPTRQTTFTTVVHSGRAIRERMAELTDFVRHSGEHVPLSHHPAWLEILARGLRHEVFALESVSGGHTVGYLPLAFVHSLLFGRYLVSLPYLNSNGVIAESAEVEEELITQAVSLANRLRVRYLELRNEQPIPHPALNAEQAKKVHMRLTLPATAEELWKGFDAKVRNQIRKGEKGGFTVQWGCEEYLDEFHEVLSRNMRDLGSPVFGKVLFTEILKTFARDAELCLIRSGGKPVAGALLLHGWGITEVPTASSLRQFNSSCVNMLMYHHLLRRAMERGQHQFDFGRSTPGGNTYRFKKQWGALPHPAIWQYHLLRGDISEMRPDNPRFQRAIRLWQRLPMWIARRLGPIIVRGIP